MIDWNSVLPRSIRASVASAVTFLVAIGGLCAFMYNVGRDEGADERELLKKVNEVHLPELAEGVNSLSAQLARATNALTSNKSLTASLARAQARNKALEATAAKNAQTLSDDETRLASDATVISSLKTELMGLKGETHDFSVDQNQSLEIGSGVRVGVNDTYPDYADIMLANKPYKVKAGNVLATEISHEQCSLYVTAIHFTESVSFRLTYPKS